MDKVTEWSSFLKDLLEVNKKKIWDLNCHSPKHMCTCVYRCNMWIKCNFLWFILSHFFVFYKLLNYHTKSSVNCIFLTSILVKALLLIQSAQYSAKSFYFETQILLQLSGKNLGVSWPLSFQIHLQTTNSKPWEVSWQWKKSDCIAIPEGSALHEPFQSNY